MAQRLENLAIGATLRIEAWDEATSRLRRVDVRSSYVERFWLPILGPSTTWLLRHFAQVLDDSPSGATVDLAEVARALGLGERSGRNGPLLRTIAGDRLRHRGAPWRGPRLGVRRAPPLLSGRRGRDCRSASACWSTPGPPSEAPLDPVRRRGRRLALSLLESLGEGVADTERQLGNWHFHPPSRLNVRPGRRRGNRGPKGKLRRDPAHFHGKTPASDGAVLRRPTGPHKRRDDYGRSGVIAVGQPIASGT